VVKKANQKNQKKAKDKAQKGKKEKKPAKLVREKKGKKQKRSLATNLMGDGTKGINDRATTTRLKREANHLSETCNDLQGKLGGTRVKKEKLVARGSARRAYKKESFHVCWDRGGDWSSVRVSRGKSNDRQKDPFVGGKNERTAFHEGEKFADVGEDKGNLSRKTVRESKRLKKPWLKKED